MRILFRLVANLLRLLLWPLTRWRRARAAPPGAYVHVEIDGAVTDVAGPRPPLALFRKPKATVHGLTELVDALLEDPNPRGLLLTLRSLRSGMATATSLRAQLTRLRDAGRDVVVHLPLGAGTREFYVAAAGTRVFVAPQTTVAPLGFAIHTRYLRRAFEKAGLTPEVFARGTYKSAGETLVRDSMSEPHREQMGALLDTFYDELVDAVVEGRHMDRTTAEARIDGAPYRATDAVANGLADGEAYEDEVTERLDGAPAIPAARYLRARRAGRLVPLTDRAGVVGIVRVHGPITVESTLAFPAARVASDEALIQTVRRARRDPRVRAVILHVDSPGGSALASDRIHHELVRLAADKPLIACMANVAASGGYYVAAPAHTIVAEPTTVTGSIGVVAARFTPEPLLERLGVATERLRRGANAGLLDPSGPLTDAERQALHRELEGTYRGFVQVVADGRNRSTDEVHAVAEGRVWIGRDALGKGLVDELGGFADALRLARERGAGGAPIPVEVLKPARTRIPPLADEHRSRRVRRAARPLLAWLEALGFDPGALALSTARERALLWFPLGDHFR